jgi:hypothetical protein
MASGYDRHPRYEPDFGGAGPFLSILLLVLVVCMAFGWAFG